MVLIADSGSTKTDWKSVDGNLSFSTSGLNPFYLNSEAISEILRNELVPKLKEKVVKIFFYGTGIIDSNKSDIVKDGIIDALGYSPEISAQSDVIGAAISVLGDLPGVACILGTGSNSCHWNGNEIDFQIPPLGFWLGDEGSGAHIGKLVILDYLHNEMPIEARRIFENKYGKLDRLEVLKNSANLPSRYFAEFSLLVYENREGVYFQNLVMKSIGLFFEKYLLKYPIKNIDNIGFVGSIAYFYKDYIEKLAIKNNLKNIIILRKPIDGLTEYHKKSY